MDVRYINPFILATCHVFKTTLKTEIAIGKPYLKQDNEPGADVSAVIGLSGDAVGSVVLSLPMSTAEKVASTFSGAPLTQHQDDFGDALGELANMIAGQAKAKLEGLHTSISLPNVVLGADHTIANSRSTPRLALPCDSSLGRFKVEVGLVLKKQPVAAVAQAASANAGW